MIVLKPATLRSVANKKKFVASVCRSLNAFLSEDTSINIEIRAGVSLRDAADALRNLAEMLDTAGSVTKADDDEDPAEWWKHQDNDDDTF